MNDEIQSMHDNQTWKLVPKPDNVKAIDCKWIFRIKEGNDSGEPPRFKARLVAKGFLQKEGIDFNDIFAPVVKYKTMRLLIAMTAVFNWELEQMDVKTAFLHGDLDEKLYMKQPIGFIDKQKPEHVCFLQKSIYGLKQSPRQWNMKFDSCMLSLGFIRSQYDSCLYLKNVKSATPLYVVLYVDDLLLICPSLPVIMKLKDSLNKVFDMKDLGKAQKILGVKIIRDRKNKQILLSQVDYIDKVLAKFSMKDCNPTVIPLGGHLDISKDDCPKTDLEKQKMNTIPYDVAVGSIMYAMLCTRPDLGFAISVLSRYMANPGPKHWQAMKYLLRYISGTKNLGLIYGEHASKTNLTGYVDSDYASNKDTRKSTTSFFFTWAGNCITWKSQQQAIVALSSTEAEYIAAVEAAKEAIWLKGVLNEIQGVMFVPTIFMDSQSALCLCKDPVYHERSKHIDVRYHFIRDMVESKEFVFEKILGEKNPADFGTKIVPFNKFDFCRRALNIGKVS
ncbi:unnamed protein product [Rhodiola kirilowii]